MISSRAEYLFYLEADRIALKLNRKRPRFFGDEIWKFQRLLRKLEYLTNCKKFVFYKFYRFCLYWYFQSVCIRLGFTIPLNVFGPGLNIAHRGTIVVNRLTKVGKNCRLHVCVSIGVMAGTEDKCPIIGDNVYIGPGVKIYGPIVIGDNIAIGANAVVNSSFIDGGVTIGGVPAKIISNKGSEGLLIKGADLAVSRKK